MLLARGVRYRAWAPHHPVAAVEVVTPNGTIKRQIPLSRRAGGFFEAIDRFGKAGDRYRFHFPGMAAAPDIASHFQPDGVHGVSMVVDHARFHWRHPQPRRLLSDLVIYEIHLGTFSPSGTFRGAAAFLPKLVELGVTAIEIMPVADFPGRRNWGYDGVMLYAPARCYGSPDEFKRLIDSAHGLGLTVILDVVYNHLGPDGNYLSCFNPEFFHAKHKTPWGNGLNFDGRDSEPVRRFFIENALHWLRHYRVDGFRLDSIHSIQDDSNVPFIRELAGEIHAAGGFVMAEDDRNDASWLKGEKGSHLDAVWVDDFHHSIRVSLKRERLSHFASYLGNARELTDTLKNGWLYRGQYCSHWKRKRGTPGKQLQPSAFIHYISNHDQAGNRPLGERLNHLVGPSAYRAASALLCLSPYTPLIWMGQEWAASTPFLFFSDHRWELGKKIRKSRANEFKMYGHHYPASVLRAMPDPQLASTFQSSKLLWAEREQREHGKVLKLYRDALGWRKILLGAGFQKRPGWKFKLQGNVLRWQLTKDFLLSIQLTRSARNPARPSERTWQAVFSSNDQAYQSSVAKKGGRSRLPSGDSETVLWRRRE